MTAHSGKNCTTVGKWDATGVLASMFQNARNSRTRTEMPTTLFISSVRSACFHTHEARRWLVQRLGCLPGSSDTRPLAPCVRMIAVAVAITRSRDASSRLSLAELPSPRFRTDEPTVCQCADSATRLQDESALDEGPTFSFSVHRVRHSKTWVGMK